MHDSHANLQKDQQTDEQAHSGVRHYLRAQSAGKHAFYHITNLVSSVI